VRASSGWRLLLSLAGLALGTLPLWQRQWIAAPVAGTVGLLVVGSWAWGSSRRSVGLTAGVALTAAMAGVFAISQWPRGLLAAPVYDWLGCWILIGSVPLALLVVEWTVRRIGQRHQFLPVAASALRSRRMTAAAQLTALVLICGCGYTLVIADTNNGRFRFQARDNEVLPLPSMLRLISADPCADGGNSGNCIAEFVVTSADGAARTTTVDRIVEHLRRLGWPLQLGRSHYSACRDVGGILPWTPHCLWLWADAEPERTQPPTHPEAVTIYIDNS
jgi:hypothetical protein